MKRPRRRCRGRFASSNESEIACNGEDRSEGEKGIEHCGCGLKGTQRSLCQNRSQERYGKKQRCECVESQSVCQVPVQKSREGASRSTARAKNAEVGVNGALRIKAVLGGWEAEKDGCCRKQHKSCERRSGSYRCTCDGMAHLQRDKTAPKMRYPMPGGYGHDQRPLR